MNAENFPEYLQQPARLLQMNQQELRELTLQYPYCANLHLLMLSKSVQSQHKDWERHLQTASAHTLDRRRLYQLVKAWQPAPAAVEAFELKEEFLELKDLQVLERQPVVLTQSRQEPEAALPLSQAPLQEHWEEDADLDLELLTSADIQTPGEVGTPEAGDAVPAPAPQPKHEFESWKRLEEAHHFLLKEDPPMPSPKPAQPRRLSAKKIAAASLQERDDVASETLADLLAAQAQYEKAIEMYERLTLLFPEKSAYFAAKIEKLKNI